MLCSVLRWKLKAGEVLERFPLLIRHYARFPLGRLNVDGSCGNFRGAAAGVKSHELYIYYQIIKYSGLNIRETNGVLINLA